MFGCDAQDSLLWPLHRLGLDLNFSLMASRVTVLGTRRYLLVWFEFEINWFV